MLMVVTFALRLLCTRCGLASIYRKSRQENAEDTFIQYVW